MTAKGADREPISQASQARFGGQWIGATHHRLIRIADELRIPTFPQYATGKKVLDRGDGKIRTFSGFFPKIGLLGLIDLGLKLRTLEKLARTVPLEQPMTMPGAAELDAQSLPQCRARFAA